MKRNFRPPQRGYSLIEFAVGLVVLGLIAATVVTAFRSLRQNEQDSQVANALDLAAWRVIGESRAAAQLPAPDDKQQSAEYPGYLEGGLPSGPLALQKRPLRYVVDPQLTAPPPDQYIPDGYQLAGDLRTHMGYPSTLMGIPGIPPEQTRAIDFCKMLVLKAQKADGQSFAFAIQDDVRPLGPTSAQAKGASQRFGYSELAVSLGCFQRLAKVADTVRAAGTVADLMELAEEDSQLKSNAVTAVTHSIKAAKLRMAVRATQAAVIGGMAAHMAFTSGELDGPALFSAQANEAGFLQVEALIWWDVGQNLVPAFVKMSGQLEAARQSETDAGTYLTELTTLYSNLVTQVNALRQQGLSS